MSNKLKRSGKLEMSTKTVVIIVSFCRFLAVKEYEKGKRTLLFSSSVNATRFDGWFVRIVIIFK